MHWSSFLFYAMKIFSFATSLFVSLSLSHTVTLSLIHTYHGSHTRCVPLEVLAALLVAFLLVDDPLSPGLFMRVSPLHVSSLGCGGGGDIGLVLPAA